MAEILLTAGEISDILESDDEINSIKSEIATILRLHDYDNKQDIVTHLLINGRQGLLDYKDDIIPTIFNTQFNTPDAQLILALKTYVRRLWQTQYESSCHWLIAFIQNYHDNKDPQLYDRILTRTAEYGNRFLKDCPMLSIVLQFVLESIDDECLLNTNTFDEVWCTMTSEGLTSLAKYSKYMKEEVMSEELDKRGSTLFRALREYYRPRLDSLLRDHGMNGEEVDENVALDFLSEDGVEKGMENIRQSMVKSSSDVVAEKGDVVLVNTDSPLDKIEIDQMIKVSFMQTGEIINIPISLVDTVEDVIKYICEKSACGGVNDYNDYHLTVVLVNGETNLDNDKKLTEIGVFTDENLGFKLYSNTPTKEQLITIAMVEASGSANDTSDIPTRLQNELTPNDNKAKAFNTSEVSSTSKSLKTFSSVPLEKEQLANIYHQIQNRFREVTAQMTRDPMLRHNITETLNEINLLVCGAPRVGKSALINAICQQEGAKTHPGLHSCTNMISPYFLKGSCEIGGDKVNYQYNIWDTRGFEKWDEKTLVANLDHIQEKPKSDTLCMIYCASPGSFANLQQLKCLLDECNKRHIFCALVCTNKWNGRKTQRDAVMEDFTRILTGFHEKTREEDGVIYFGNVGLCTSVNSVAFIHEDTGKEYEQSGINELILGIMESIDKDKAAKWCAIVLQNKPFWTKIMDCSKRLKRFLTFPFG
ncbi:unnamed protein product [Adineta ricciae]|uniref:G domain-containing protein n=1 Tax=Adineta ricciae TaxID=249248 RepID=A0A815VHD3_ADIRI|nr:unnamed protein product [Adineta ricciae]